MSEPYLIQNAVHIPGADLYLVSLRQDKSTDHTFDETDPSTGQRLAIGIAGGTGPGSYPQRVGALYDATKLGLYVEWCLLNTDPFEVIADRLLWEGLRGGYRPIKEASIEDLKAASEVSCVVPFRDRVIHHWLKVKTAAQPVST